MVYLDPKNLQNHIIMQLYEEEGRKKIFYTHLCTLLLHLMLLGGYCLDVEQDVAWFIVTFIPSKLHSLFVCRSVQIFKEK